MSRACVYLTLLGRCRCIAFLVRAQSCVRCVSDALRLCKPLFTLRPQLHPVSSLPAISFSSRGLFPSPSSSRVWSTRRDEIEHSFDHLDFRNPIGGLTRKGTFDWIDKMSGKIWTNQRSDCEIVSGILFKWKTRFLAKFGQLQGVVD